MGFFKKMSHEIIPLTTCYVQDTVNDVILDIIRQYIEKYKISVYDEKTHKGNLRHVVTKVGFHTHEIMVILVTKETKLPKIDALVEMLEAKLPGLRTVVQNINPNRTNVILGRENKIIYGDGIIEDTIDDLVFEISPLSFYQVNPIQTKVLYNKALELADISSEDVVYDIYCGIGTISLFLAKKAKHVYGIEIVKEAIENAKKNAEEII
jgi:23S rRNA m(5)U-1939 methyltransferase (EC 2.1.1.-)